MDFLKDFGLNPILLAAQVVNFLILLFILNKLLYRPILRVLNERRKRIEKSLKNAEEIERRLHEISEREAEAILRGAKEGEKIIKAAGEQAALILEEGTKEYQRLINKGVEDAKNLAGREKEMVMQQVREHIADIVALVFEKIMGKKIKARDQNEIMEKEVKNLS